jgi:DNA polymerase III alpha subunit (gram-positive type)
MKLLFLDCETSGLPANHYMSYTQTSMWPNILQISWQCIDTDNNWTVLKSADHFIKSRGPWNKDAERIHQIPESIVQQFGKDPLTVFSEFELDIADCDMIIAHNMTFDKKCIMAEIQRLYNAGTIKKTALDIWPLKKATLCTMVKTKLFCGIKFPKSEDYKFPKLAELYAKLFDKAYDISGAELHNSKHDVSCLIMCFKQMLLLPEFTGLLST